jgi:hypothetical protein
LASDTTVTSSADLLARALAQRDLDPNEVAKTFTHLRALYERAGEDQAARRAAVAQWWRWLATVAGPGARAVVRSGRTQGYYRTIEDACRQHLDGLEPEVLVQALGWAVRLLRYYQSPGALERPGLFGAVEQPRPKAPERERPAAPKTPTLPAVGDIFTGKVLQVDESAVVVEIPGFAVEQAIGAIKAEALGGRRYRADNTARVEVIEVRTLKSGRTLVGLRPAPRREQA